MKDKIRPFTREIQVSGAHIFVTADEPSNGGASHAYDVQLRGEQTGTSLCTIQFQEGPIGEVGPNGLSEDTLLRIVADRLQGFQRGPFSCRENALALTKIDEALHWLMHRTFERALRGVEGTSQV